MFLFNRFYLNTSLLFSFIIPLIVIPVRSDYPINITIGRIASSTASQIERAGTTAYNIAADFSFANILICMYFVISGILLIRFVSNIIKIYIKIIKGRKIDNRNTSIVLIQENTLPYSFLKFIFINLDDFEKGEIENELLLHEEAHCLQYHSIDMLFIELLRIFFWFNPVILLYKKSLQLNHEFSADSMVLMERDVAGYRQILLKVLVRNNSSFLVSNFKYSFIKNRIVMMTKENPGKFAFLRKLSSVFIFLTMIVTLAFSQETITFNKPDLSGNFENEWWFPLLRKHNIDIKHYTYFGNYKPVQGDSTGLTALELGCSASINKQIFTLKEPVLIVRTDEDAYTLITAEFASHNLVNLESKWAKGKLEEYKIKPGDTKPFQDLSYDTLMKDSKNKTFYKKN